MKDYALQVVGLPCLEGSERLEEELKARGDQRKPEKKGKKTSVGSNSIGKNLGASPKKCVFPVGFPILGVVFLSIPHSFQPIVLFENQIRFPRVSGGFLERRIPGKNGGGTPGSIGKIWGGLPSKHVFSCWLLFKENATYRNYPLIFHKPLQI